MSRAKRAFMGRVRFCPGCGTENLQRDMERAPNGKLEFTCSLCGLSCRISPSLKWQQAQTLFSAMRKLRPSHATSARLEDTDGGSYW